MKWDDVQQVLRIVIYAVAGYFFGDGVVNGELFQSAVAGLMSVGNFAWWFIWNRGRDNPPEPSGPIES